MCNSLLEKLHAMDRNLIFSGQLFLREMGPAIELDYTSRRVMVAAGLIAVPEHVTLKGEHQYSLAGLHSETNGIILGLDSSGKDITEIARGNTPGGLLLRPIWKI